MIVSSDEHGGFRCILRLVDLLSKYRSESCTRKSIVLVILFLLAYVNYKR